MAHEQSAKTGRTRQSTDAEMTAAAARGRLEMNRDGARSVRYDERDDEIEIILNSGVTVRIPRATIPGLEEAKPEDLKQIELSPMTTSISFERLDADYSVQGLIRQVLGLNDQQRVAGSVKSPAKHAAAVMNGQRGGRPAKRVATEPARSPKKVEAKE